MAMTECGHGHIYDSDVYASCPYCNSAQPVIQFGGAAAGGQGGWAAYDQSRTEPIRGGFGPSQGGGGFTPTQGGYGPGPTQGFGSPQGFGPGPTQGFGSAQDATERTAPIGGGEGSVFDNNVTQPPRGYRRERRADEDQKTVGDMKQRMGIEPVVGWLVCIEGKEKGTDYRLWGRINTIGRGEKNDVCIKSDMSISKENHARLGYDPKNNRFRLIPASSANNIYLNGDVVDIPTPLKAFDVMEFGETKLVFVPLCCESFSWEKGVSGKGEAE